MHQSLLLETDLIIRRTAVRALLLAEPDLLLLSRVYIPDAQAHIWIAPGGGLEPGESPADALIREVREETMYEVKEWIGPVWMRRHEFRFKGDTYDQSESFYLIRSEVFDPDHSGNPAEIEQEIFDEFRWWSLSEIADSNEQFVPRMLARHLDDLIRDGIPSTPVEVGI